MQRMSRRVRGWSGPGSAEEIEWRDGAEPLVRVVVELRAPGPKVPTPPRCSPGAANWVSRYRVIPDIGSNDSEKMS